MSAPTVIKWSDAGAPALTNAAGSLISILDYCLPQRGWIREFSGTNKAIYRAGTGNRKLYRILDDNSFSSGSFYSASVTAYDSMTGVDSGAGWGQTEYIRKSYNDSTPKRWICIVDETGFFIITQPHGGTSVDIGLRAFVPHYFGETVPALTGQSPRDIMAGCNVVSAYGGVLSHTENIASNAFVRCSRSLDGSVTALNIYSPRTVFNTGVTAAAPVGNFVNAPLGYPYNGDILYTRPLLMDNDASKPGDYIPWFYLTCQKGGGFINGNIHTASDGTQFLAVYVIANSTYALSSGVSNSTGFGCVLISISESR